MDFPIAFLLFFVCAVIAFTTLITVIYFFIKKKRNKMLYVIPMIIFVIFTFLAFYLAITYFNSIQTEVLDILAADS